MKILAIGNFLRHDIENIINNNLNHSIHFYSCKAIMQNDSDIVTQNTENSLHSILKKHPKISLTTSKHLYITIHDSIAVDNIINEMQPDKVIFDGNSFKEFNNKKLHDIKHDTYRAFLCILPMVKNRAISINGDFLMPEILQDASINISSEASLKTTCNR